jgi:hypothetical protein|tara:strand:- start:229 stop:660 length:432 start_codon:yes stop_codon:yes gene_type:complete
MRPLYETSADLAREKEIASDLERKWGCKFIKMPIRYHLDFVLVKNDVVVAYAELKTRNYSMEAIGKMGGYLMSIGKWQSAKSLSESSKVPFILIVKTLDGLYRARFDTFVPDSVLVRGRTDRDDWQDIEPCVLLNVNKFIRVN